MLRVNFQGSIAVLFGLDIVFFIFEIKSGESCVGVDDDEYLSEVGLTGNLIIRLFFVDEIDG